YTSAPKIVSSLSATPSNVSLGENISVSMYIQNIGDTAANNVVPSALTVSGTGNVNLLSGPIPTSTNIGGHSQSSFTWTYKATSSGTIAFSGNATADGGIHSSVGTSNSINILTPPELQVTLSASPSEVIVGDTINVSMTVHNIGQSKATNVTPSNLSISGGGMASLVSGPLPNSADILGNSNTTFNWTYMATQAGSITFNGNANADGGISSPFSSSNIINIQTPASLEISILISPSSVDLGDTFNITMNVKNKGDSNANNVRPSALIKTGDGTVSFSTGPNPPSVTINGHSESSFTWTYTATGTGQVAFTGNVSADGGIESPETTSNILVIKVPPSPPNILSYIVVNPDSLYEGELIEVVMTVDNMGDMEATNVYPSNLIIGGVNGVAILRSGPYPVNVNIGGHSSQTFKWIYYAEEEGRIYFSGHANGDGSLSSPTSTSNILTIKRRPLPPPYPSYNKLLPMRKIMSILNDNKCNDNPSAEGCSI
ncbi:MAG: protein BatD, partial [Bacteroidales bacterium]|nr:protein BatD [Bacteroidales bacterium]